MNNTAVINLRKKLFSDQNGLCHWCLMPMVLLNPYPPDGRLPDNAATIDHLYSKLDPRRPKKHCPVVGACRRCNHQRGEEFKAERDKKAKANNKIKINRHAISSAF